MAADGVSAAGRIQSFNGRAEFWPVTVKIISRFYRDSALVAREWLAVAPPPAPTGKKGIAGYRHSPTTLRMNANHAKGTQ